MESFRPDLGIIFVDHGSTHDEANEMLVEVARSFRELTGAAIVEAAHMELAPPMLREAFARCVEQGATQVVIHPYFLSPGRHSIEDIPAMAEEAAHDFPGVRYCVTEPLGLDPRMGEIVRTRIEEALAADSKRRDAHGAGRRLPGER